MTRQGRIYALLGFLGMAFMAGCAPSLSEKDQRTLESHNKPYQRNTDYRTALTSLGNVLNTGVGVQDIFQVKPIENKAGGEGLPYDVTEMVISSVNTLSGDLVGLVPYDPEYIQNEAILTTGQPVRDRTLPNIVITGAITEFDEAISLKNSGVSFTGWSPLRIENRDLDPDIDFAFDRAERVSRISLDFHLLDYATLQFYPQMHVTNTILVVEIEKGRSWGFKIYGSGPSISGRITVRQGLHQAVRNLVDYSIVQLFGLYYALPFWQVFSYDTGVQDHALLDDWRQKFLRHYNTETKIWHIQRWLSKYELGPVYIGNTLQREFPKAEIGRFGNVTQAFALKFLYQYRPNSKLVRYVESGNFPQNDNLLADLYMELITNIPIL